IEQLLPYAAPGQGKMLRGVLEHGSLRRAEKAGIANRRSLQRAVAAVRKRAALQGWSPRHDMTHTVPDGFSVKGVSTLYNSDGEVAAQWVKSQADAERQIA